MPLGWSVRQAKLVQGHEGLKGSIPNITNGEGSEDTGKLAIDALLNTVDSSPRGSFVNPRLKGPFALDNPLSDSNQLMKLRRTVRENDDVVKYFLSLGGNDETKNFLIRLRSFKVQLSRLNKKAIGYSPLRLLVMAISDKVNGQEKKNVPFLNHIAYTIEMISIDELYDVGVIDEI
ncbi:hypothetical protein Cgig2_032089 [Carnegiea gigantea]|uniref:ATP-dependent RNA helicase SUV3 DEXQ-box helicase domain-containing protein n=1 Tax=Carnegiea gigantea TaxID=171969 RepID=A0A9Q1JS05_9CARY|nr:hypothetical protein Cgig2_032089 [Carnegiea gigantea]